MSKKRDPLAAVINYFTVVDLTAANTALGVVKEIVRSRRDHQPPPITLGAAVARQVSKKKPGLPKRRPVDVPLPLDYVTP